MVLTPHNLPMPGNPYSEVSSVENFQELPPPGKKGWSWVQANLFSDLTSSFLTFISSAFLIWALPGLIDYLFISAVWRGENAQACAQPGAGACWVFIQKNFSYFFYTAYPTEARWRVDIVLISGAFLLIWLLWPKARYKGVGAWLFFLFYPILCVMLLYGAPFLGLSFVPTHLWGGVFVTLIAGLVGIVFSLPLGILLALGRQSSLPLLQSSCVIFIELVRGMPLIIVLFMANTMLPLFVPVSWTPDRILRPLIGIALFSSAYMAEVIRGGLQAVPKGQIEGAKALGLNYRKTMHLIILPQALTLVIPGIVNTFIGLFKDTTLVAVIGIFDFLQAVEIRSRDPNWLGPSTATTGYIFAAFFYFLFCLGMSRYSQSMERKRASAAYR